MSIMLRWHVSRIYEPEPNTTDGTRSIHFNITPQAGDVLADKFDGKEDALADVESDEMGWWLMDEEQEIEGRTRESLVVEAVTERNVRPKAAGSAPGSEARQLEENMVLLQFVREKADFDAALAEVKASGRGLADVSSLVEIKNAGWLDFTKQARKMAAGLYFEALKETEVSEDASQ